MAIHFGKCSCRKVCSFCPLLLLFVLSWALMSTVSGLEEARASELKRHSDDGNDRVVIDIFVMSKCPDAILCESKINEAFEAVGGISTVRPNYIADIRGHPTICKHGELECAGDKQQLCVFTHAHEAAFWSFLQCQNQNVTAIGELDRADFCLSQLDILPSVSRRSKLCYTTSEGDQLLRNNIHSTQEAGVTSSCTIWIDGSSDCINEASKRVDCDDAQCGDLARTICERFYEKHKFVPHECAGE